MNENDELAPPLSTSRFLPELSDVERENLQAAVSELFNRQAILRDAPGERDLYEWTRLHFNWVREVASLVGFDIVLNEDDQLIYALPNDRSALRRLRLEWTLVLLSLWYDYDVQLRAEGPPVVFSVEALNDSLKTKLGDRMPTPTALKDILGFFASRKLLRLGQADDFAQTRIEVLPTIRFVLPFGDLEKVSQMLEELMARPDQPEEVTHG